MQQAAAGIAVYLTLMQFSQRALEQLKAYHESLPLGHRAGPGFDAGKSLLGFQSSHRY